MAITPLLTNSGLSLLLRAISGEQITFTRFKAGNGTAPSKPETLTDLVNPLLTFGISAIDAETEGYVTLTGSFDNTDVETDFRMKELGIFCEDANGDEYLYAYANDGDDAGLISSGSSSVLTEQEITMIVAIGQAEHVTARISASALYASKTDFDNHVEDRNNPHGVTKEQVGLGSVPNVSTNDQTPTYEEAPELQALVSGEKLGAAFGKLKKAVSALITHVSSKDNPHGVTLKQLDGAKAEHDHSAADITSGALAVDRGGTGSSTLIPAMENLNIPFFEFIQITGGTVKTIGFGHPVLLIILERVSAGPTDCQNGLAVILGRPGAAHAQFDWSVKGTGQTIYVNFTQGCKTLMLDASSVPRTDTYQGIVITRQAAL